MRAPRFLLVLLASIALGGALAAGQTIVLDPDADPAATIPGPLELDGQRTYVDGFDSSDNHWLAVQGGSEPANLFLALQSSDGSTADRVIVAAGGGSTLTVTDANRVGIGTEDPTEDLDVAGTTQGELFDGAYGINWDFEAGPTGVNKRIPGWETTAWFLDHDSSRGTVSGRYAYGEESCCDHDDSGSGGGVNAYDLYKRFAGEFGNDQVNVSVWAEINSDTDGVGTCSAGNAYVGEDDARIILTAYDANGDVLDTKWGQWGAWHASQQGYPGDGDTNSRDVHDYVQLWLNWTAPSGTKMLEVDLHAGEATDSCRTFAAKSGGNSAVYFDDFNFETTAEGWKDLGGQDQYRRVETLEVTNHADIEGNVDLNSNYLDNKEGLWASYLTTTQSSVEGGTLVNLYENVDISDGTYSKNDANTVTVQRSGIYRISYQVNVHRTGSGARNIMRSYIRVNGGNRIDRTATACYIRTNGNGDECTNSATVMLSLSSGDTVEVYTHEERGGETGNDIEHARINMEYLG